MAMHRLRGVLLAAAMTVTAAGHPALADQFKQAADGSAIDCAVSAAPSPFTSQIATFAPSSASRSAIARPIPDPAPVTTAQRPFNERPMSFSHIDAEGVFSIVPRACQCR